MIEYNVQFDCFNNIHNKTYTKNETVYSSQNINYGENEYVHNGNGLGCGYYYGTIWGNGMGCGGDVYQVISYINYSGILIIAGE